ncbi:B-(1-6) glucan synthase [Cyathus striatus]|nr:B-(1-6) glucan synthase [Cyathus striatus]
MRSLAVLIIVLGEEQNLWNKEIELNFSFSRCIGDFGFSVTPTRTIDLEKRASAAKAPPNCFPAIGFTMPTATPSSLTNWWCDRSTEYAFVGFSYEVTACQSLSQLRSEFLNIRQKFKGRYVRLYGFCDRTGFISTIKANYALYSNDIVDAAWGAGIGVHALIWFGWDGTDIWKTRRDALFGILHSNAKAKYVTRVVQFGSEPLYDWALDPSDLAAQVISAKANLSSLQIPVTVSEMAYGYQEHKDDGGMDVLAAIDFIDAHMLPFFSTKASIANNSWPIVLTDLNWFVDNGAGKKIYLSENGWPSVTSDGVQPNSPSAVANVQNEKDYYNVLDSHCSYFKTVAGGGVGWFAHIYSDNQEPGYGIYGYDGSLKFSFSPKISC